MGGDEATREQLSQVTFELMSMDRTVKLKLKLKHENLLPSDLLDEEVPLRDQIMDGLPLSVI